MFNKGLPGMNYSFTFTQIMFQYEKSDSYLGVDNHG